MKQSFDTWCPLFPGFYNTVFEPDEESLIQQYNECNNTNYSYEDFEWDYKGYFESIGRGFVERLEAKFQELLPIKIEYQSIYHPKYYNCSNDVVNVRVTVSLNRLLRLIVDDIDGYTPYFREEYTSRSGFVSLHSNQLEDWLKKKYILENPAHRIGALLECLASCHVHFSTCEDLFEFHRESVFLNHWLKEPVNSK
jgi:hypothetical protein